MESGYLKLVKDWQMSQERTAAAMPALIDKSAEQLIPKPIAVRKGLHLDVDEILRRSLPRWPNQDS